MNILPHHEAFKIRHKANSIIFQTYLQKFPVSTYEYNIKMFQKYQELQTVFRRK